MKAFVKKAWWIIAALMAVWAPGMNLNVQSKLKPDAFEIGGYLHQIIGRTFNSIQTDSITLFLAAVTVLWILRRYLYHKPQNTGVGEYLLCGFFSVMQLLHSAVRQTGSVQTMYANVFQMLKGILYLAGMFVLFLCAVRALNELLAWRPALQRCAIWDRYPYVFPFVVLSLAWLPHLIIKYPGTLFMDTVLQYRQFIGLDTRLTSHPPFGTVVYGLLISLARGSEYTHLVYFFYILIQTLIFIAILAYGLWVMNRHNVPMWVCWGTLALFSLSPIYVGWTTVISKDSSYLLLCMLAGILLLENQKTDCLYTSCWRKLLLAADLILLILVRNNGILIAVPLLAVLLIELMVRKAGRKSCIHFALRACAILLIAIGIKETIIWKMDYTRVSQNDWMSMLFQQTGRVVALHDKEIPQEEKDVLNRMFLYDEIKQSYQPQMADFMRWNYPLDGREKWNEMGNNPNDGRSEEDIKAYFKVWWEQFKRYPIDCVDALVAQNGVLFDLQDNWPVYLSLTDHFLSDDIYQNSFNDMEYYNAPAIRSLNGIQRALTEGYHQAHKIPLVGCLFSMGYCIELMIIMIYLGWISGHRKMLFVCVPALVTAVSAPFCAIVYVRYLLPTMGALPLWFASWMMCEEHNGIG